MRMDTGKKSPDAVIIQRIRKSPAVAVDIRRHRIMIGKTVFLQLRHACIHRFIEHSFARKVGQVEIISRKADISRLYEFHEVLLLLRGSFRQKLLNAPIAFAIPFEPRLLLDELDYLPNKAHVMRLHLFLRIGIPYVRMRMVNYVNGHLLHKSKPLSL